MRLFIGVIGLYLVVALALPLGIMLAKSLQGPGDEFVGLANYARYFSTPALFQSIGNSLWVSFLSTAITVPAAFLYAYALTRSRMPMRGLFKTIALVPILVPSLLPGLALVYLFGNQGLVKGLLLGHSIYGPIGIVRPRSSRPSRTRSSSSWRRWLSPTRGSTRRRWRCARRGRGSSGR